MYVTISPRRTRLNIRFMNQMSGIDPTLMRFGIIAPLIHYRLGVAAHLIPLVYYTAR